MARKPTTRSVGSQGSRLPESGVTLKISRSADRRQSRRQRRQQQKKRHLEAVKTTAESKLQQPKHPGMQQAGNRLYISKSPSLTPVGAQLKSSEIRSISPKSWGQGKQRQFFGDKRALSAVATKFHKARSRSQPILLYGTRLLILGIGISAIAGTILSASNPTSSRDEKNSATTTAEVEPAREEQRNVALSVGQEIFALKAQIQAIAAQNPKLQPGVFFIDLDTGAYVDIQAAFPFSAASTIKLPILVAFFQDVDAGKIRLDEKLIMQPTAIAGGSGDMQYQKPGKEFTALETATKMIAISDNTATNMLIARLGGAQALNERFRSWGLTATAIQNALPDLEGTNTTSPRDLARLMAAVNQGQLITLPSRDRMLDIMQRTVNKSLLPAGLGKDATIAHKTGDIATILADVGLIDLPIGKRYIAVVMVKRPYNDATAQKLIRQISALSYQYFSQPAGTPIAPAIPPATSSGILQD